MGLLAYSPYGYDPLNPMLRNVTPFVTPQAPQGQGAGPQMFPQAQPSAAPTPQAPRASWWQQLNGQNNLPANASLSDRLNASMESPLFNLGMGIVASSGPGGTGADFASYMQNYQRGRTEKQRYENEQRRLAAADRRAETQFGWAEEAQQREAQRRGRMEGWAGDQRDNPLAAVDPELAFQAEAEARAIAGQPITPYQQAQLDLQRRALAVDAARANMERPLRGSDRELMDNVREAAGRSQALTMLGEEFLSANGVSPTGELSRFNPMNIWDPNRRSMTAAASQMRAYMRPPGSGATSDYEQRIYAMGVPSVDNTGPQNQAIMRYHQTAAQIAQARRFFYEDYAQQNGSLNGAEQAFQQSPSFQNITRSAPLPSANPQQGETQQERPQRQQQAGGASFDTLPPASQFREGQRITDQQTGRSFVIRNGRWVPERSPADTTRRPDGPMRRG